MNPTPDTRTRLLDLAQDLLQRQSISGVSFQELAKRAGIKKGSLFYHFESKDALTLALLDRAKEELRNFLRAREDRPALSQLKSYIRIYSEHFGAGEKLCPGGIFAAEWGTLSDDVRAAAKSLLQLHLREIARMVRQGFTDGSWPTPAEIDLEQRAQQLALWIVTQLQGALVMARVLEDPASFDQVMAVMLDHLGVKPAPID